MTTAMLIVGCLLIMSTWLTEDLIPLAWIGVGLLLWEAL